MAAQPKIPRPVPAKATHCSERVEQLVADARAKLLPGELPDNPRLCRYAALLVAAERYDALQRAQLNSNVENEYQAEGELYGIGNGDRGEVERKRNAGRQAMSQLRPAAEKAQKDLARLVELFNKNRGKLSCPVIARFPNLDDVRLQLSALIYLLDTDLDPPLPVFDPAWDVRTLTLVWWNFGFTYHGRWRHQFNLARIWDLQRAGNEESFQASVYRLVKRHTKVPDNVPSPCQRIAVEDRSLFPDFFPEENS